MTLAAQQDNVAGGSALFAKGSRTGTRTAGDFTITLGFNPKYVKVTNLTDRISAEWFEDTGNALQLLTVAAGTRTFAATGISVADNVVTVVVATAGLETDDDAVVWEAHA
jgi:hypothetical protein